MGTYYPKQKDQQKHPKWECDSSKLVWNIGEEKLATSYYPQIKIKSLMRFIPWLISKQCLAA
jgi:hypothetical protein